MPMRSLCHKNRVSESAPFTYTGIYYFGPLYIESATGSEKVWVCDYSKTLETYVGYDNGTIFAGISKFVARCGKFHQTMPYN